MKRASLSMLLGAIALAAGAQHARGQSLPTITYPAGPYTLTFPVPVTITTTATSITFSWGVGPTPTPVPPTPVPPAPVPIPALVGHVWGIVLYDPAVPLTAAQQAAQASANLVAQATGLDINLTWHAKTEPAFATWLNHLPPSGLPAIIFATADATGKAVIVPGAAQPLPVDEAGILALVNKVRGK